MQIIYVKKGEGNGLVEFEPDWNQRYECVSSVHVQCQYAIVVHLKLIEVEVKEKEKWTIVKCVDGQGYSISSNWGKPVIYFDKLIINDLGFIKEIILYLHGVKVAIMDIADKDIKFGKSVNPLDIIENNDWY